MPEIVFIIGAGRSGSSILHELLGYHPRIGWMSYLCDTRPFSPETNRRVLAAMRLPLIGRLLRRHFEPHECYRIFDVSYPGFSAPMRDLVRSDVTDRAAREIRSRLAAVIPADRTTLVVKITGWPRIGFLAELFPEAKFVHLVRDGRAVANSLLQVSWWHGWRGPANWRFGPLPARYETEWVAHKQSFAALAAIEWKLVMEAVEDARSEVTDEQFMNVRYEDLCADDERSMRSIVDHMGLDWATELDDALVRLPLKTRNDKWRDELGAHNASIVNEVLRDMLPQYGYSPAEHPTN